MDGTRWNSQASWASSEDPCVWSGIVCNGTEVTSIELENNGLFNPTATSGGKAIPTEIVALTGLSNLNLATNLLAGSLPSELETLTALRTLNLRDNFFSNEAIPAQWQNLTNLEVLDLGTNDLR